MDKCNLHTILRLPTGIFYAQGVKTNVLFFERGKTDKGNTEGVWFYDLRTDMPSFGKRTPLTAEHFADFEAAYTATERDAIEDDRWSYLTREEVSAKEDSLDLGLMRAAESSLDFANLDPAQITQEAADLLAEAVDLLRTLSAELGANTSEAG